LDRILGDEAFRRFSQKKDRFEGGFSISAFESLAIGVGYNYKKAATTMTDAFVTKVKGMWSDPNFVDNSGSGVSASSRVPKIVPYGRKVFAA